jgi:ATP synthase protein I
MNVRPFGRPGGRSAVRTESTMFFPRQDKPSGALELLTTAGTIGLHLVSATVVGLAMGYFLDKWLGTAPWCLLIFLLSGIGVGFRDVFREARRIQKRTEEKERRDGQGS